MMTIAFNDDVGGHFADDATLPDYRGELKTLAVDFSKRHGTEKLVAILQAASGYTNVDEVPPEDAATVAMAILGADQPPTRIIAHVAQAKAQVHKSAAVKDHAHSKADLRFAARFRQSLFERNAAATTAHTAIRDWSDMAKAAWEKRKGSRNG